MNKIALVGLLFNLSAYALDLDVQTRSIYGVDNRRDIFESSDNLMIELSRSTAAQIFNYNLIQNGDTYTLKADSLQKSLGVCSNERFANQPKGARCSGFLIAPDKILTAGHCETMMGECWYFSWVFDYANTTEEKNSFTFNKDQVYHCKNIIKQEMNYPGNQNDYAIVELDRPVIGRTPLKLRTEGKIPDDATLTVIGNPVGLPTKITDEAIVRENTNPIFFKINSDTFGGNSGSAVINSKTGIVEGILVRGDDDFVKINDGKPDSCLATVKRGEFEGKGESVTRISSVQGL